MYPIQTHSVPPAYFGTPDTSYLKDDPKYDSVYEPAEDTFLLLDALENEIQHGVIANLKPVVVVEIGSGSGCVSTFLALHLPTPAAYITTDINRSANLATLHTAYVNKVAIDTIHTNLLDPFRASQVDLLLFNPPYVTTTEDELHSTDAAAKAWAGGAFGCSVILQCIPRVCRILSENGLMYMVVSHENQPDQLKPWIEAFGFIVEIIIERKAGRERLYIFKIQRRTKDVQSKPCSSE